MTAEGAYGTGWRTRLGPLMRTLGATTGIGLVIGVLVGGVGGRLAMRLLALTSGPSATGVISDDGFRIGQFSAATLNLLVTGALFGVVGSFTYLAVRPFLLGPSWLRALTCALASGAVLGSIVVNPDGVDFTVLSPVWLAVALFVVIPALFGALAPPAIERALATGGWARTAPLRIVAAPLAVFLFPPLLILLGIPVALVLGARWRLGRWPRIAHAARRPWSLWTARVGWAAVAILGLVALAGDVSALR